MNVLSWLDNRTLLFCDFLLAAGFAAVLFVMKRAYPNLRGIDAIAFSFVIGVPGAVLLALRGSIPYLVSVCLANSFILASFLFLYRGILRFLGSRRTILLPSVVSYIALAILIYFTLVQDKVAPRIFAISITIGLVRGLIALELFRKSPSFPTPWMMRLFAASMAFFAAISVNCGIFTVLHGAPSNIFQGTTVGTATLLSGVVFVCVTGLFILMLASNFLIARSREESQKDSLSGVFNRRGIEAKLAAELKAVYRSHKRLSIALIDIDYFKSINDIRGHAAGDDALRDVADTITTHLRGRDSLGRYGGDEFLLVLPETPCHVALIIADRLSQSVGNRCVSNGEQPITLSIGVTEAYASDDAVTVIARADKALYQAKSDGRNCRRVNTIEAEDPNKVYRAMGLVMRPPVGPPDPAMSRGTR